MRDEHFVSHFNNETKESPLIDPEDAQSVIETVATNLARRYWWLTKDELIHEAWIACKTTDVLTKATSPGAFHERIKGKLIDGQKTEREWREERIAPMNLVDWSEDGRVFTSYDESGDPVQYVARDTSWRGTSEGEAEKGREWVAATGLAEDKRPRHVVGGRSRLLDRIRDMSRDDFLAWAGEALTDDSRWSAKAKMKHLETYLCGSSREKAGLWERYVNAKRIGGTTGPEDREARLEDWQARYRWDPEAASFFAHAPEFDDWPTGELASDDSDPSDRWARIQPDGGAFPLVVSADGESVVVATLLRESIR